MKKLKMENKLTDIMPKIKLIVGTPKFIAKNIFCLIKEINFEDYDYRNFVRGLPSFLAEKIKNSKKFKDVEKELIDFVKKNTDKNLIQETEELQKAWDSYNDKYFLLINNFFKRSFPYKVFFGYVSDIVVGNYGEKNSFVVRIEQKVEDSLYCICEEVLHIIYWNFWREIFNIKIKEPWQLKEEKNGLSVWKISETIPEYIFQFKDSHGREKFYPWIPEVRKILDPLWKNRKSFKDFLIKAHKGLIG